MIRNATQKDAKAISSLMKSVPGFWNEAWREDVVQRAIDSSKGLSYVWDDRGSIGGFVCAHDVGFRAYLSALFVAENLRGKGIGKQLVTHVENELLKRGCLMIISDVWREAEGFYRSLGWSAPPVILLRKNLSHPVKGE